MTLVRLSGDAERARGGRVIVARVRWGNRRFFRINEFASLSDAHDFAGSLRKTYGLAMNVAVERLDGDGWRPVPA